MVCAAIRGGIRLATLYIESGMVFRIALAIATADMQKSGTILQICRHQMQENGMKKLQISSVGKRLN